MKKLCGFKLWGLTAAMLIALLALPHGAHAACSNPVGVEGEVIYNSVHSVPQYCDNTDWIAMTGGADGGSGFWAAVDGNNNVTGIVNAGMDSAGDSSQVCALGGNGEAYCWGDGDEGALGNGTTSVNESGVPLAVLGGFTWKHIATGIQQSCGVTNNRRCLLLG